MFKSFLVKNGIKIFFLHKTPYVDGNVTKQITKLQNALNFITDRILCKKKNCVPVSRVRFYFLKHGLIKNV